MFGNMLVSREGALKQKMAVLGTETGCFATERSTDATSIRLLVLLQRFLKEEGVCSTDTMHDMTSGKAVK